MQDPNARPYGHQLFDADAYAFTVACLDCHTHTTSDSFRHCHRNGSFEHEHADGHTYFPSKADFERDLREQLHRADG